MRETKSGKSHGSPRGSHKNPVKCLRSTEGNTKALILASILFTDPGLTYED